MNLKELLLSRLGKRGEMNGNITLSSSLSVVGKYSQLRDLIERTILPRQIKLVNSKGMLSITVAEKIVFAISGNINGGSKFEQIFATSKKADLNEETKVGLAKVLANKEECTVSCAEIEDGFELKGGMSAARIIPIAPAPKVKAAPSVEKSGKGSDLPLVFLSLAHKVVRKARYFSASNSDSVSGQLNAYSRVEPTEFTGIRTLHQKLSPALGENLLFLVIAEGDTSDTFAIATNGSDGAVIELGRQKLGRISQIWRELAPSAK